jgi:hypothetical protein
VAAAAGWTAKHPVLKGAQSVISFAISDSGIGHCSRKTEVHLRGVSTSRRRHQPQKQRYGSGSDHLAQTGNVLGGEIRLTSSPGKGSTITLYLPLLGPGTTTVITRQTGQRRPACFTVASLAASLD